jgi:phospholipase C
MKLLYSALLTLLALATPAFATVNVSTPVNGSTVTSPVTYAATATTSTCATGVASMGIYVNNILIYVVNGAKLNTQISLAAGYQHTVVEEWDRCGGATFTTINLTVKSATTGPTVNIASSPASISQGGSSKLTVTATNSTKVTVTGSDGSSYPLSATGGTVTVTPTVTTTYTADATGSTGSTASASTTVTVGAAGSTSPINHVIFMLQENRTFDNYFGMLNPYRRANGWSVGDDGRTYLVDGIDDKLNTTNVNDEGVAIPLFKLKTTCIDDASSSWLESYGDVNRYNFLSTRPILMDGFVHTAEGFAKSCAASGVCHGTYHDFAGKRAMGYYDQGFLNYYYYLASQFAVSDRWFSPIASKSTPNRLATFTGGTTQGLAFDPGNDDHIGARTIPSIFEKFDGAGVSWKVYYTVTAGSCVAGNSCGSGSSNFPSTTLNYLTYYRKYLYANPSHAACTGTTRPSSAVGDTSNYFCIDTNRIAPLSTYFTDLTNNRIPSFAFIESGSINDEHPNSTESITVGQAQMARIINAFMKSPVWKDSVFFFSYDEGGGPYDHVPPVPGHSNDKTNKALGSIPDISSIAVNPDAYKPCLPPSGTLATAHCDLRSNSPGAHSGDAAAVKGFAAQLGFRVPNIVVSPFTRRHYVSHIPMDHTAVIKFVENRFMGGSAHLTARDAAQPNLLDFFDFSRVPWAAPPTPPAPNTANPCTPTSMGP